MTAAWPAQEPRRVPTAMIGSVNPLASAAGLQVLREGGNAVDAAVAAGAVLTVVEPWSGQLGGDAFMLIHSGATGKVTAINGSGAAPRAATLERYRQAGGIPESGWLASSVPGLVDAWQVAVDRFGTRPLGPLLEAAIDYAQEGFPLTERQSRSMGHKAAVAARYPESAAIFLPGGAPPRPGERFVQRDLGRTLRTLRAEGAASFYTGSIAAAIVAASERGGGLFSAQDLAEHRTEVAEPLEARYRGWTVLEQPPVSQGIVVLLALQILQQFDLRSLKNSSAETVHLQVEAHKLALGDRLGLVGDPRFVTIPTEELLSAEHARRQAQRLERSRARVVEPIPAGRPDTTYLCVVDRDRNIVSYIHSLYSGSGVVAGDTGILLNDRMLCFSMDERSPNALAPGKRPVHTLNSWMLVKDGQPRFVGGTPGAFWQVQTNLQVISQLVDVEAGLQEALDAPRWSTGSSTGWAQNRLSLEARFGQQVLEDLKRRGHPVQLMGDWAAGGSVQAIEIDPQGMLVGAGDPRPGTSAVLGY